MIDDDASPELRALNDRLERGEELTETERKQYAELVHQRLLELSSSLRMAASPVIAEVDQIKASVKALGARVEELVEGRDGLSWVPGETTQQLLCDLLDVAHLVLIGARWDWDEKEFVAVRERLDEFEDVFWYRVPDRADRVMTDGAPEGHVLAGSDFHDGESIHVGRRLPASWMSGLDLRGGRVPTEQVRPGRASGRHWLNGGTAPRREGVPRVTSPASLR